MPMLRTINIIKAMSKGDMITTNSMQNRTKGRAWIALSHHWLLIKNQSKFKAPYSFSELG